MPIGARCFAYRRKLFNDLLAPCPKASRTSFAALRTPARPFQKGEEGTIHLFKFNYFQLSINKHFLTCLALQASFGRTDDVHATLHLGEFASLQVVDNVVAFVELYMLDSCYSSADRNSIKGDIDSCLCNEVDVVYTDFVRAQPVNADTEQFTLCPSPSTMYLSLYFFRMSISKVSSLIVTFTELEVEKRILLIVACPPSKFSAAVSFSVSSVPSLPLMVDGGKFDWKANPDKFPTLSKPDPSYHGIVFADAVGAAAYVTRIRAVILRDTGAAILPFISSFAEYPPADPHQLQGRC